MQQFCVRSCHVCKEPESSTAYSNVFIAKHIYHRADPKTILFNLLFIAIIPIHIVKIQHINKNKTHFQYMSMGDIILSCFKDTNQGQSFAISSKIYYLSWQLACLTSQISQRLPGLTKPSWRRRRQKRRTLCPPKKVSKFQRTVFTVSCWFGVWYGNLLKLSLFSCNALSILSFLTL